MIYMLAEVALKRKAKGIKLNHPEAVAVIFLPPRSMEPARKRLSRTS